MLQAAIRSLGNLEVSDECEVEVVVVDNASTEGAVRWAESGGCRVISLPTNCGFGTAVNCGISNSKGKFVVVMNDDVELESKWLAEILSTLERSTESWFACGKTLRYADRSRIDGAGDAISRGGTSWRIGSGRGDGELFDVSRPTYFPSGTATLFRRTFFGQVGTYDEGFFAYLEDMDLGLRAAGAGCGGIYVPTAEAYHHGSQTGQAWSTAMVRWITTHQILLLAKHYRVAMLVRFGWHILVGQTLWAALSCSRGRTVAWLQGLVTGLWRAWPTRRRSRELRARNGLAAVLTRSEAELARFQRETGFDAYWKWYFRLAGEPK